MRQSGKRFCPRRGLLALCGAVLMLFLAGRALCAGAEKAAPAGCSMQSGRFLTSHCFPLETEQWRCSDGYGWRTDPLTGEKAFHRGVDLACATGTPICAVMDGVVTAARQSETYGNVLCLSHAGGLETRYAHLQYCYVRAGEVVQTGQLLGTVGQTGRATGAHLHFELLSQGIRQDPARALGLS